MPWEGFMVVHVNESWYPFGDHFFDLQSDDRSIYQLGQIVESSYYGFGILYVLFIV